jgi:hypothetical protein
LQTRSMHSKYLRTTPVPTKSATLKHAIGRHTVQQSATLSKQLDHTIQIHSQDCVVC